MQCDYFSNKGAVMGLTNFAGFAGSPSMGAWKFRVGDSAPAKWGRSRRSA